MYLKRIIYTIWEELESLNINDDTLLEYDFLKDKVIAWNNTLISEAYNSKMPLDAYYQIVPCIEVTCERGSCSINGIPFVANEIYYKAEMPGLNNVVDEPIRYFGLNGFEKPISNVSFAGYAVSDGRRFTAREAMFARLGDTIIVKNIPTTGFGIGTVVALLNDPTDACNWDADDESDFPTPSVAKLVMLVEKDILSTRGHPDLIHDSQIAAGQPQQKQQPQGGEQ